MNRIDTETGYIYLGNVVITPDKKLDDYKEYEKAGLVSINDLGEAGVIVKLVQLSVSNGIKAEVTVYIDSAYNITSIYIVPKIHNSKRIVSSKKWIAGMIENCNVDESKDPFFVKYSWGYVSADYDYDPHNGQTGGNIKIRYD